jgi:hypothetical protein
MARTLAAINVNGLTGHKGGRLQKENRVDNVGDLAHPAERVQLGELRMCFDGMHRRLDDAGRAALTLMPSLAYSIASDLVAALKPPFVSEASTDGTCEFACSTRLVVICTTWPLCRFSISAIASCVM